MARYIGENDINFYRVVSTILNRRDNTTSIRRRGPYSTAGAAKGQAGNGWYSHTVTDARVQKVVADFIDHGDGQLQPVLAWMDVAVYDGTQWVNVEEKNSA